MGLFHDGKQLIVTLSVCPWCYETFPCAGKCILVYTGASKVPTQEIAEGIYLLSPAVFVVVRGPGKS